MMALHLAATAVSAAFLGSLVEAVEALTIVLAVASVRGSGGTICSRIGRTGSDSAPPSTVTVAISGAGQTIGQ